MEVRGVNLDEGEVGGGVGANDFGVVVAVVVEGHLEALGVGDDVVVGDDVAVFADDNAGAEANLTLVLALLFFAAGLLATGLFAAARRVEEEVEEVAASEEVVSKGVVAALLARGGIAFYGDNAVDR